MKDQHQWVTRLGVAGGLIGALGGAFLGYFVVRVGLPPRPQDSVLWGSFRVVDLTAIALGLLAGATAGSALGFVAGVIAGTVRSRLEGPDPVDAAMDAQREAGPAGAPAEAPSSEPPVELFEPRSVAEEVARFREKVSGLERRPSREG